jgi:hypothetical protein
MDFRPYSMVSLDRDAPVQDDLEIGENSFFMGHSIHMPAQQQALSF